MNLKIKEKNKIKVMKKRDSSIRGDRYANR